MAESQVIVLASRNRGKVREINQMLGLILPGIKVKGLDEHPEIGDIPETGATFEENALIKAREVAAKTGKVAVADDSGLVVPGLGGEPGVFSARYAGEKATDEDNNRKLLDRMSRLEGNDRRASFVCVMAAVSPGGHEVVARGDWSGYIAREPRGDNGFGYDPLFYDSELCLHSAEMNPEQKNARSHRGRALKKLAAKWKGFMAQLNYQEDDKQ